MRARLCSARAERAVSDDQAQRDGASGTPAAALLRALDFAADKHRDQRRKGEQQIPYINHCIAVAHLLAEAGVADLPTLQAAVLHDTLEDTDATPAELEAHFGAEVRRIVEEVTDAAELPWRERKERQVQLAPSLSVRAKLVRIADKIDNVRSIATAPPDWPPERQRRYLDWTERVVAGCRGCNAALETLYDRMLRESRAAVD